MNYEYIIYRSHLPRHLSTGSSSYSACMRIWWPQGCDPSKHETLLQCWLDIGQTVGQNLTSIGSTSRVGLQCCTVYWRWLYFHVVRFFMIAVVSTRIKATTPHTRDAWSVMREAWCVFTEIIENRWATPHARHAWCVFVLGSRIHRSRSGQHASREPTMTSFDGFSQVPPKILACDPGFQGQPRADPFVDYIVFFSCLCSFLVTITLLCQATWLIIRIWGSWSIRLRNTQHYMTLH